MTPSVQALIVSAIRNTVEGHATIAEESCPSWLIRPGRTEIGSAWGPVTAAYTALTGLVLPEKAPTRERRRLDVIVSWADGSSQVVEIDEEQHFTAERFITLDHYPAESTIGYSLAAWRAESAVPRRARGGGWGRACPPLFPGAGGRHRRRAFRDMLADLLPPQYGWRPTVRLHAATVAASLGSSEESPRIRALLAMPDAPD